MSDDGLCGFEKEVLLGMAGLAQSKPWGAAMGAALESLKRRRLVWVDPSFCYRLTDAGKALAQETKANV